MNKKLALTVFTSLIATAIFALEPPPVGSAAPDFSLPDAKDQPHSLSQYKGKYVVLEWFNPECPFVKKHYGSDNMQKLQKEYTDKGVVWLTIDSNAPGTEGNLTPEQAQKVATSWKTQQTALLLDPDGKVGRAYGSKNTPNMVIINPEGKIAYDGAIDSNRKIGNGIILTRNIPIFIGKPGITSGRSASSAASASRTTSSTETKTNSGPVSG